jgi:hypothetical protein
MALATYGDLKTTVARYLGRADLTSSIPDHATMAHAQLMRDLRGHPFLQTRNAAFSITGEYVDAPADMMELVSIARNDSPTMPLQFMQPDMMTKRFQGTTGSPLYYCFVGDTTAGTVNFRFGPPPDGTYTATVEYYARITFFSSDGATNWILTDHPDVYLYGTLLQATGEIKDDPRIQLWDAGYQRALESLKQAGKRMRWAGNSMAARAG